MARFLARSALDEVLARLARSYHLHWPGKLRGKTGYIPWQAGQESMLDHNPDATVKELFLPRTEVLMEFDDGQEKTSRPLAVFGVRPCDARAVHLLDRVFVEQPPVDGPYQERRQGALFIGMACPQPQMTCFCSTVGGGPFDTVGLDVLLTPVDEGWVAEAASTAGEEYLEQEAWPEATKEQQAQARAEKDQARAVAEEVELEGLAKKLEASFEAPVWERLHEKCLGCAVCTYYCPTCHCFDVTDTDKARLRTWDSCMFPLFTLHTSGHNPRLSGKERMRQRVMHKFCYFPLRLEDHACVGCGRCIELCPVNLDIRQVLAELGGCL